MNSIDHLERSPDWLGKSTGKPMENPGGSQPAWGPAGQSLLVRQRLPRQQQPQATAFVAHHRVGAGTRGPWKDQRLVVVGGGCAGGWWWLVVVFLHHMLDCACFFFISRWWLLMDFTDKYLGCWWGLMVSCGEEVGIVRAIKRQGGAYKWDVDKSCGVIRCYW